MSDDTVLVAGGGIAGLALGRALRQRGVPFELAERDPMAGDGGLAINLPGNAVAALHALGLRAGLEKIGRPTRRREYRSAAGRVLFAVDEDAFWGPDARPRCVRRSDLHALLGEDLDRTVTRVASVALEASGVLVDGRRHGFVVGADGVRSTVRDQVFGRAGMRSAMLSRASWRFMAPNPGVDCFTVWSGAEGAFLMIPVDESEVYVFASATGGGTVDADPAWLRRTFGNYPAPVRAVLDDLGELYHSPIEEVRIATWHRDRCVLIGDAAHATAPVWAQGGALAMEDALVLADLLAGGAWDSVGARYEEQRRERVCHVQAATDRFSKVAGLPIRLRNALLPVMGPIGYRSAYGPLR
ncbi:FAD-dependent monooxygenase [Actinoplanes sp. NPDC049596]|uniref:FAD-dependent monooxygenase n=1 Tax=unclassified Actinoplanes TaxID=2626549 RepID=UPI0034456810